MFFDIFSQKVPQKFGGIKKRLYLCIRLRKPSYSHPTEFGEMVEWSITTVLKTVVPRGTGGSNPSLSARAFWKKFQKAFFIFTLLQLKKSLSFHDHKNPFKINHLSVKGDFYNPIELHNHKKTVKEPIALITAPFTWSWNNYNNQQKRL